MSHQAIDLKYGQLLKFDGASFFFAFDDECLKIFSIIVLSNFQNSDNVNSLSNITKSDKGVVSMTSFTAILPGMRMFDMPLSSQNSWQSRAWRWRS